MICRQAVRALVCDSDQAILLLLLDNPGGGWRGWITPGGGSEPGESPEATLRRELREELGLRDFRLGCFLWQRTARFTYRGQEYEQHECYYRVDVARFAPDRRLQSATERVDILEMRWWTAQELLTSTEVFSPSRIAALWEAVRQGKGVDKSLVF